MVALECELKRALEFAGAIQFDRKRWSAIIAHRLFRALYGETWPRIALVATMGAIAINGFGIFLMHNDWVSDRDRITRIDSDIVTNVDAQYTSLISTTRGRSEVARSFVEEHVLDITRYKNNDPNAVRAREIVNRYKYALPWYEAKHGYIYDLALERYFGSPALASGLYFALVLVMLISTSTFVDSLAAYLTIRMLTAVSGGVLGRLMRTGGIALLFLASIINYSNLLVGNANGLLSTMLLILALSAITVFSLAIAIGLTVSITPSRLGRIALGPLIALCTLAGLLGPALTQPTGPTASEFLSLLAFDFSQIATAAHSVKFIAVLMASATIFPLVLYLTIPMIVTLAWVFFNAFKEFALGQIHGVAIISGGTYFLGILTTLITCTTTLFAIARIIF